MTDVSAQHLQSTVTRLTPVSRGALTWLRVALAAYLVVDACVAVLLVPRAARLADLARDLEAGRVSAVALVTAGDGGRFTPFTTSRLHTRDSTEQFVLWRTQGLGRLRGSAAPLARGSAAGSELARLRVAAARARVPVDPEDSSLLAREQRALPWVVLVLVGALTFGPQPRRATRWAWFWRFLLPCNAGLVWWLLREVPWSTEMARLPEPPLPYLRLPWDVRTRAGAALVMLALASVLVAAVFSGRTFPLG